MSATDDWCDAIRAAADDMLDQSAVGRLAGLPLENRIALATALLRGPRWGEPYTVIRWPEAYFVPNDARPGTLVLRFATTSGRDEAVGALGGLRPNPTTKS